jgi:ferredoxin
VPNVSIDSAKCQGHGRCTLIAPSYFEVDDSGYGRVLIQEVAEADLGDVREAVLACPESAITLRQ